MGADLAYVQLMSKFNKGICFLLCVIDTFSIYEWDISLKDKRVNKTTDAFQKINKGSEFYNMSMKSSLEKMT